MILCRPVYQRASLIAFSFASAPPFVKNDIVRSPGVTSASIRASVERGLGRHRRADRAELVRLLLDRGDDLRMLVPEREVDELRREVEVALPVVVPEVASLAARDRDRVELRPAPTTSGGRTPSRRRRSAGRAPGSIPRSPSPRILATRYPSAHDRHDRGADSGQADQPLDRRPRRRREVGPDEPGVQPGDRTTDRRGRPRVRRGSRRRPSQAAKAAFPAWRATSLAKRAELFFSIRELVRTSTARTSRRSSRPSTARCSPTRSARSRAGSRSSSSRAASRHLLKGGYSEQASTGIDVYSIRQPLGVVGGHHAVQLPGDGADVDVRAGDRVRQHVRAQAVGEGSVGVGLYLARAAARGRPAGRRVQRRARRQGRGRRAARASRRRGDLVRRLDAGRAVHLLDCDVARASAARRSRVRRTTWSCCRTPTSTWRPTPRCRPATAPRASAAWRSRWSSPSATSPSR